jgi:DNA recombination protein RmuC
LTVLHSHLARVGKGLSDAVGGYNQFLGSLESRVLPSARRLAGIVATEQAPVQMPQVDIRPRATGGHDESPDESAMLEDTG